jgi:hypothetical protein
VSRSQKERAPKFPLVVFWVWREAPQWPLRPGNELNLDILRIPDGFRICGTRENPERAESSFICYRTNPCGWRHRIQQEQTDSHAGYRRGGAIRQVRLSRPKNGDQGAVQEPGVGFDRRTSSWSAMPS